MQQFWNERYSKEEMAYGHEPNVFFREQLEKLQPGRLLLPAEGEGRNALYAASKGWDVLAFDFSEAGQAKALALARQQGITIEYQVADAHQFETAPDTLDAVALIYAHFPAVLRLILHRKVVQWLKPGGVLILEAFHPKQLDGYTSGGPTDETMLYTPVMLLQDFEGLEIQLLEEREVELQEGTLHSGKAYVTRLVATKPNV